MRKKKQIDAVSIELITLELNEGGAQKLFSNTIEIQSPNSDQFYFRYSEIKNTDLSIKTPLSRSPYISLRKLAEAKNDQEGEILRLAMENRIPAYYFSIEDQVLPSVFFNTPTNLDTKVAGRRYFEIKYPSLANLMTYFFTRVAIAQNAAEHPNPKKNRKALRPKARGQRKSTDDKHEEWEQAAFKTIAESRNVRSLMAGGRLNISKLAQQAAQRSHIRASPETLRKYFGTKKVHSNLTIRLKERAKLPKTTHAKSP